MAFFGLTALGPQNTFESALPGQTILHIFDEKDFKDAFERVSNGKGFIRHSEINELLNVLYHGPAPEADRKLFLERICTFESLTWEQFRKCCLSMNGGSCSNNDGGSRQHKSYSEYRDLANRHVRTIDGPSKKFTRPLTVGQEFGWNSEVINIRHEVKGRKSCPETIYAHELAKSGIMY